MLQIASWSSYTFLFIINLIFILYENIHSIILLHAARLLSVRTNHNLQYNLKFQHSEFFYKPIYIFIVSFLFS